MSLLRSKPFPNLFTLLRNNFLTGFFLLIPFGVSAWILGKVISAVWSFQSILPETWQPGFWIQSPALIFLVNLAINLLLAFILVFSMSFLGWISKRYAGARVLDFLSRVFQRIPVVRSVFGGLDQLVKTLSAGGQQQFSRVVYVEYPRRDCWTLAFVTGEPKSLPDGFEGEYLNIYVPTTPNPTSGFFLIVSASEVRESGLRVEDAFKMILSFGIATGGNLGKKGVRPS